MRRTNSLEKTLMLGKTEGKRRSGCQRMGCLGSITDPMGMDLGKFSGIIEDKGGWCAAVHGVAESWT